MKEKDEGFFRQLLGEEVSRVFFFFLWGAGSDPRWGA